ncbi:MAG: threonine synthase [Cytophagales bacterium]|nr:threonine synthase [Cytophagales bacterium]
MRFYSTNREVPSVSFKEAVLKGLPDDNGLYMPEVIPRFTDNFLKNLHRLSFNEIAFHSANMIVENEIDEITLRSIVDESFRFDVPVKNIHDNIHVLELFHGPTLAFKDFGARFMARTMGHFLRSDDREITILVATSGDTGSAVAQGFLGVEGIKVMLLYPGGKVSKIQEQQLTTIGQNITAIEIDGTFDDCQHLVKTAFLDEELNKRLNLSSANSINIARLLPQSFYYTYAFSRLEKRNTKIYFCVPSGNFGNLCGGLLAKKMGLPVEGFIAASNINDVVPQYLETSVFRPKKSVQTISNAMDVGNPSNFARLLDLYNGDYLEISKDIKGVSFNDNQTRDIIREVYTKYNYLMCPHTAIGYGGLSGYLGTREIGIYLSTAHPCKFKDIVEPIISEEVEIPLRLKKVIDKKKRAIAMTNEFDEFKSFLIETN